MKIIHLHALNIPIFADALRDTECILNASIKIDDVINSLQRFNGRDVLGLVVFRTPLTKKCLRLIKAFDETFIFKQLPIIVVSDYESLNMVTVKHSKLYKLESDDNTISDVEINKIMTTLLLESSTVYDLSICGMGDNISNGDSVIKKDNYELSDDLKSLLNDLDFT